MSSSGSPSIGPAQAAYPGPRRVGAGERLLGGVLGARDLAGDERDQAHHTLAARAEKLREGVVGSGRVDARAGMGHGERLHAY